MHTFSQKRVGGQLTFELWGNVPHRGRNERQVHVNSLGRMKKEDLNGTKCVK